MSHNSLQVDEELVQRVTLLHQNEPHPSILVTKEVPGILSCLICGDLALAPKQCSKCKGVYCRTCIDEWLNLKQNKCPSCLCLFQSNTDDELTQALKSLLFSCSICHKLHAVEEREAHIDCSKNRCPLCSEHKPRSVTIKDHLELHCNKM